MKYAALTTAFALCFFVSGCDVQSGITQKSLEKYQPTPTPEKIATPPEEPIDPADPLARAAGIENVLEITVRDAGVFRVSGPGAGGRVTAGAVYADLARLVAGERPILFGKLS